MSVTIRAYHRPTEIVTDNQIIQDGDIVLLPDLGPGRCVLAIKAKSEGETRIRKLTHAIDEVLDTRTVEENQEAFAQPRYARSVAAALDLVNTANDTIIPFYNSRFRLLDHFIPGRTRERELYRHSVLVRTLPRGGSQPLEVIQVWYGGPEGADLAPGNFVGLVFSNLPRDHEQRTWSPTHSNGLHTGMSLGRFPDSHQAGYELIRFDLAATAELQQDTVGDDQTAAEPISYDPMLED